MESAIHPGTVMTLEQETRHCPPSGLSVPPEVGEAWMVVPGDRQAAGGGPGIVGQGQRWLPGGSASTAGDQGGGPLLLGLATRRREWEGACSPGPGSRGAWQALCLILRTRTRGSCTVRHRYSPPVWKVV